MRHLCFSTTRMISTASTMSGNVQERLRRKATESDTNVIQTRLVIQMCGPCLKC